MKKLFYDQFIPLTLTVLTFLGISLLLFFYINILNFVGAREKILTQIKIVDVTIGLTIYLKTSIDFAIFIGNLMKSNPGWKKRVSIEIGTAVGNAIGIILILTLWNFFREIPLLMLIMIIIASLVLLLMAEESVDDFLAQEKYKKIHLGARLLQKELNFINRFFKPFLGKILPNLKITNIKTLSFFNLLFFSLTIPLILGLDDFAGYIPLFSIVNVFGFAIGVFLGHMILNLGLFLSPSKTIVIVRSPLALVVGASAFTAIALWGFYEAIRIIPSIL